ncbi:fructosamine kinase family protein [Vreelandella neptunia]|uniref:Fructosamine kinase family protein n=1 Tax=Vreelandella neptunia TaxID=115551 RepID=A0ABS9S2X2_9GAMM|nr:fructosamine kinase family protein [Halomonas neptunia]MCH4810443.1 fructosamine kinase family protein [Halomonas neptunia]
MNSTLKTLLNDAGLIPQGALSPLSGGDSAATYRLGTDAGEVVVKRDNPARLAGEADGLRALASANSGLIIPAVLAQEGEWLVMKALETVSYRHGCAESLGEGLRRLHGVTGKDYGWPHDNACGRTPQPNTPLWDGRVFQRERRLLPLIDVCSAKGLLGNALRQRLETIAHGLESWLPDVPASLVHGDLWSGNVLCTAQGAAVIDPAVYRHFPEVDLAMLTLFGSPGEAFFEAYWNGNAPADWPRREALFQLNPLLNHLLLFGGSYRAALENAVIGLEAYQA